MCPLNGQNRLYRHPFGPYIPRPLPFLTMKRFLPYLLGIILATGAAHAQSPYRSSEDFARYAMKLRENAILQIEPKVVVPTTSHSGLFGSKYPWKTGIVTTIFWVGENASTNNPVHNHSSSWDLTWSTSFGGFDNPDPAARANFIPIKFQPRQNPFYVALPYNDVTRGTTKPESRQVIPWFRQTFEREGKSVCRDRWVAIRNSVGKVAYAQWSDCGPFRTDHWQYVFGNERPKPNLNQGAGLDVSPAVRDYLGLASKDVTDWKFVEFREIPAGPWSKFGDNNTFVQLSRRSSERVVNANSNGKSPTILTR
ncbi:MAG: hypothetical protein JWL59_2326 [Chthoniobacteraceae bacterium]|nr:hypothetical protein [Chthoniobacteraceae bacterium]